MGVAGGGSCDFIGGGFAGPGAGDLLLDLAFVFLLAATAVIFFLAVLLGVYRESTDQVQ